MEHKETVIDQMLNSTVDHAYLGPITAILLGMKMGLGGVDKVMNASWLLVLAPVLIHLITILILETVNYFLKKK